MQMFWKHIAFVIIWICVDLLANPNGARTQFYHPNLDGIDYLGVNSGKNIADNQLHLGLYFNRATNTAPRQLEPGKKINPKEKKSQVQDELQSINLQMTYGLTGNFALGISLGANTELRVKDTKNIGYAQSAGINESILSAKYQLISSQNFNTAILANFHYNFLQNNPYLPDSQNYYSIEIAQSLDYSLLKFAVNAGYIYRNSKSINPALNLQSDSDQVYASAGLSLGDSDTRIINEIYYLKDLNPYTHNVNRLDHSVEVLLGLRLNYKKNTFYFAESTELKHGLSSADNRIILGYQYNFTPKPRADLPPKADTKTAIAPERRPELVLIEHISFYDASSVIIMDQKTQGIFTRVIRNLKTQTYRGIIITGHTAQLGDTDSNAKLSLERAQAVLKHLAKNGIDSNKLVALGMGSSRPITRDKNPETDYLNERIEIKIQK